MKTFFAVLLALLAAGVIFIGCAAVVITSTDTSVPICPMEEPLRSECLEQHEEMKQREANK